MKPDIHAYVASLEDNEHFYIGDNIFSRYEYGNERHFFMTVQHGYIMDSTSLKINSYSSHIFELQRTAAVKSIEEIDEHIYNKAKKIFEMTIHSIDLLTTNRQ